MKDATARELSELRSDVAMARLRLHAAMDLVARRSRQFVRGEGAGANAEERANCARCATEFHTLVTRYVWLLDRTALDVLARTRVSLARPFPETTDELVASSRSKGGDELGGSLRVR